MNTITLYKTEIKFLLEHLDTEAIKIINIKNYNFLLKIHYEIPN